MIFRITADYDETVNNLWRRFSSSLSHHVCLPPTAPTKPNILFPLSSMSLSSILFPSRILVFGFQGSDKSWHGGWCTRG